MSEYGVKIKNYSAGILYDLERGVRRWLESTPAMLSNSLFLTYLKSIGLDTWHGATRDVICISFDFGSRSYEKEMKRLNDLLVQYEEQEDTEQIERVKANIKFTEEHKDDFDPRSREELREIYYRDGVTINYTGHDGEKTPIHYKKLYRSPGKAKVGQCMFVSDRLYDKCQSWLTMGITLPEKNCKIVEIEAYKSLVTSTIVGTCHIPVNDVLILEDQDSFFSVVADIVKGRTAKDEDGNDITVCDVTREKTDVKNTLWDGMGLIESKCLPDFCNGMALLRNHFFKACVFRTRIQLFFKDWCRENGYDYDTYKVRDMFGYWHFVKDVKMITTDNAIKWKKIKSYMGLEPYDWWASKIKEDGENWGIVKTDHPSKLGNKQSLSYQMVNSLPINEGEVEELMRDTVDYVERLKYDDSVFFDYLRRNENYVNGNDMLLALVQNNPNFVKSRWFTFERKEAIKRYIGQLRHGEIIVDGDNLTLCGNPYALLLYAAGDESYMDDPTLRPEKRAIQCFTTRFDDKEYLCGFRSPQNNPANVVYLHNKQNPIFFKYFDFSDNIIAVNCIQTDIQPRLNGCDFDSDFVLVSNNPVLVEGAKRCYKDYPTVVNALNESGKGYDNTPEHYAEIDNNLSKSRLGIGWSSNLAQLAMTYYWTELKSPNPDKKVIKELRDSFVILAVMAQIIIDGAKRVYEVDGMSEIKRIRKLDSMKRDVMILKGGKLQPIRKDYPLFFKYIKALPPIKDHATVADYNKRYEMKRKIKARIDYDLICPMNYLEERLDRIQGLSTYDAISTYDFMNPIEEEVARRDASGNPLVEIIEKYDKVKKLYIRRISSYSGPDEKSSEYLDIMEDCQDQISDILRRRKVHDQDDVNRIVRIAIGSHEIGSTKSSIRKCGKNALIMLYRGSPSRFLKSFKTADKPLTPGETPVGIIRKKN